MMLPANKTPFSPRELVDALGVAYVAELGHPPAHAVLAVLCAQVALETANGTKCIQWNVGNFKAGCSADECQFVTTEWLGDPPQAQQMTCSFSAWPSLADGCEYYLHALYTWWPDAWSAAVSGDADAFAAGLRKRGYYTAPLAAYAAGVRRWQTYYAALLGGDEPPPLDLPDGGGLLSFVGLLEANSAAAS
jgi:hypothetical protein